MILESQKDPVFKKPMCLKVCKRSLDIADNVKNVDKVELNLIEIKIKLKWVVVAANEWNTFREWDELMGTVCQIQVVKIANSAFIKILFSALFGGIILCIEHQTQYLSGAYFGGLLWLGCLSGCGIVAISNYTYWFNIVNKLALGKHWYKQAPKAEGCTSWTNA